jgi:hypothetical protein
MTGTWWRAAVRVAVGTALVVLLVLQLGLRQHLPSWGDAITPASYDECNRHSDPDDPSAGMRTHWLDGDHGFLETIHVYGCVPPDSHAHVSAEGTYHGVTVEPSARGELAPGVFEFDVVVEPGGYGRVNIWQDRPPGMVEGDTPAGPSAYVVSEEDGWHFELAGENDGP